ncbi:MAG TPA: hypothetical protein VLM85_26700 [Polyangiaceae bacterium]|nr:hypothetical protein [Polyangiaceae bacterium]
MLLLAFAGPSLYACGGENAEGAAHTQPPPREVLGMSVHVNGGGTDDTFCPALEAGLVHSGVQVVGDASQPADVQMSCRVFVSQDDGFFRMTVNGQTKKKFTVRVEVRGATGRYVDQFVASYKGYEGAAPDEDAVSKLVLAYAYSPHIASYARAKGATPAPPTTDAPPPTATATEAASAQASNPRDDAEWFRIDTVKCKIPARPDACSPVRYYLSHFPNGAHADEARELLSAAQPALEKLQKDDVAWQKASVSECRSKRNAEACAGVEAYEMQFPTGMHGEEAHRLLKAAGVDK